MPDAITIPERDLIANPAGRVSPKQRAMADRLQRGADSVAITSLVSALKVATRAQTATLAAFRVDTSPLIAYQDTIIELRPILSQAMVLAALIGIDQQAKIVVENDPARKLLSLAGTPTFTAAIRFLQKRLTMSEADLLAISKNADKHVIKIVADLAQDGQRQLLKEVRDITAENLNKRDGIKRLKARFEKMGIAPRNKGTLETVFRTQTQLAYAGGAEAVYNNPDIDEILWGYKYVTVGDDRVRDRHIALDGVTLPKGHPFWEENSPPNGFNCRCSKIALFDPEDEVAAPNTIEVDGRPVKPGADPGFGFRPGTLLTPPDGVKIFDSPAVTTKPTKVAKTTKKKRAKKAKITKRGKNVRP